MQLPVQHESAIQRAPPIYIASNDIHDVDSTRMFAARNLIIHSSKEMISEIDRV